MKIPDSVATNTRILFATLGTGANRGLGLGLGRHARYWSCFSLFALTIIPTFAQSAQQRQPSTLMDRDLEIATALSAAPPEVRPHAGVYVLEQNGFVKVRESQNGFNCIIERRANHTAPMCYDAEGSTVPYRRLWNVASCSCKEWM